MKLQEVIEKVVESDPQDWNVFELSPEQQGFAAVYTLDVALTLRFGTTRTLRLEAPWLDNLYDDGSTGNDEDDDFCRQVHEGLMEELRECSDELVRRMVEDGATRGEHICDLLYDGSLVLRTSFAIVDDGVAWLPVPEGDANLCIPAKYADFVQWLHTLWHGCDNGFQDLWNRVGFSKDENAPWPDIAGWRNKFWYYLAPDGNSVPGTYVGAGRR